MSSENENYITLDNISEIQDIVDGDFVFTISKGVIYKLDFQNFVISKNNTDFYTTIDSLSSQVVSNTQSLCSINGYINDNKNNFTDSFNTTATVNALSSNWASTHSSVYTLSAEGWLPTASVDNPILAGSMVFYNSERGDWDVIAPGTSNSTIKVSNGVPTFGAGTDVAGHFRQITSSTNAFDVVMMGGNSVGAIVKTPINQTIALDHITDLYSFLQINCSLYISAIHNVGATKILVNNPTLILKRSIQFTINDTSLTSSTGTVVYPGGNAASGDPITIQILVTGEIQSTLYTISGNKPGNQTVELTLVTTVNGTPFTS